MLLARDGESRTDKGNIPPLLRIPQNKALVLSRRHAFLARIVKCQADNLRWSTCRGRCIMFNGVLEYFGRLEPSLYVVSHLFHLRGRIS